MEIEIKGHSGCKIDVVSEEGQIYVYKSTADPKYLERLALQAKKQVAAASVEYQHIRVPQIYDIQQNDKYTKIKMQYVFSRNFVEFFNYAGFEQIDSLIVALEHFIEYEIGKSELQKISASVFQNKFAEIRAKIEHNPLYASNDVVNRIITFSQQVFDGMCDMLIPVGTCHGDLTLSNILFNGNNYYLIDFLDSFIETPLQDIVKIRQDTAYRWSLLMYTKSYDAVRVRIICDKIDSAIDSYFSKKYEWYNANYRIVQLMNILRILPYAHEGNVIIYLQNILNSLLNDII